VINRFFGDAVERNPRGANFEPVRSLCQVALESVKVSISAP